MEASLGPYRRGDWNSLSSAITEYLNPHPASRAKERVTDDDIQNMDPAMLRKVAMMFAKKIVQTKEAKEVGSGKNSKQGKNA